MSALNRNLREFMAANKPPSRIAADVEAFVRNRERAAAEKAWDEGYSHCFDEEIESTSLNDNPYRKERKR